MLVMKVFVPLEIEITVAGTSLYSSRVVSNPMGIQLRLRFPDASQSLGTKLK